MEASRLHAALFILDESGAHSMKNIDNITFERWQSRDPRKLDLLLECDWCGYDIEEDELVKTPKGPMHWPCWQEAEERGLLKGAPRETPWPLEPVTTRS